MTGTPALKARLTTGVSGAASKGEMNRMSTCWVRKFSTCDTWVFTFA